MGTIYGVRRIGKDQSGAAAVEFAIVAGIFFMLMLGIIEYGMIAFTKVVIESATLEASRSSSIGSPAPGCTNPATARVCTIEKLVSEKTLGLISPGSVKVTAKVVSSPTTTAPVIPDICLDDARNPYPANAALCTSWVNNSGGPGYDPPPALANTDLGAANELVEIRVTYLWRVLFPMFRQYFGENGVLTISSSTVVKNEPFSDSGKK